MREVLLEVEVPRAIGNDVIAIPEGSLIILNVRMEAVVQGVLFTGRVAGLAVGECVRCLEQVDIPLDLYFQELFTYEPETRSRGKEVDLDPEDEEDPLPTLVEELADLEPTLVDVVVPNLPYRPLCQPGCPGLCPECGALLAQDPTHQHDLTDNRWSGLSGLVFEESASVGDTKHLSDDGSSQREQEES